MLHIPDTVYLMLSFHRTHSLLVQSSLAAAGTNLLIYLQIHFDV